MANLFSIAAVMLDGAGAAAGCLKAGVDDYLWRLRVRHMSIAAIVIGQG